MRPDSLNVFDFDGTLIRCNCFREISRDFLAALLKKCNLMTFLNVIIWFILRKFGIISHFVFKRHVVGIFEKALSEPIRKDICQSVFDNNVNRTIFDRMINSDNCIICTTAPFAYISRIYFGKDIPFISALDPQNRFPDATNFGEAKVVNLKAYFKNENIHVVNFFTDNEIDDRPLINLAVNAFVVKNDRLMKMK
jgi:hypothetical protein